MRIPFAVGLLMGTPGAAYSGPAIGAPDASASPMQSSVPTLTDETRAWLVEAARDPSLESWQQDFMRRLAAENPVEEALPASDRSENPHVPGDLTTSDGAWIGWGPPSARDRHAAIYDPVRDRMLVFGGSDGAYRNDTWVLTLGGAPPAWTQLSPSGTPPSGRHGHTAIYDPVRDRMVVFGGWDGFGYRSDTWALTLGGATTWSRVLPTGTLPSGRQYQATIYDPVRDCMVVFGGYNGAKLGDAWTLTFGGVPTWSQMSPTGTLPSPRDGHAALYDPARDQMVVFGGSDGAYRNDTWVLTLGGTPGWRQVSPAGTPPSGRWGHAVLYDSLRDQMVVFGGWDGARRNDAFVLTLGGTPAWSQVPSTGTLPSARYSHAAIYDPVRDRMVAFGGSDGALRNDTWVLRLGEAPARWVLLPPGTPPSARAWPTATYDPLRDRIVVFGGTGENGLYRNDSWVLQLGEQPTWAQLSPAGTPPSARYFHTAIYDPVRERMVVFGGSDGAYRNDTWVLTLGETPAWARVTPSGTPPGDRSAHGAIYDPVRDRMVVFGGYGYGVDHNDTWALTLGGVPAWSQLFPTGTPPSPRGGQQVFFDSARDRMVLFGGWDGAYRNDTWVLTLWGTPAWSQVTPTGTPPSARFGNTAILDPVRDRMVVFAGNDGSLRNDTWALSLGEAPAWLQMSPTGTPPNTRWAHTANYDPVRDRMLVFGGFGAGYQSDTWALTWGEPPTAVTGLMSLDVIPSETAIEVRWGVRSREEYLGFHVLRSNDGTPFTRVTEEMIPNAAESFPAILSWVDEAVEEGADYAYKIEVVHPDGTPEVWDRTVTARVLGRAPLGYGLRVAGANPHRIGQPVEFAYEIPRPGALVSIAVFDVAGRRVATLVDGFIGAGVHSGTWRPAEARRLASGTYLFRLEAEGQALTRKMVLLN